MFNIDPTEFILLLVLGIIVFGPEKLPEFARKAAHVYVYIRDMASNAQKQLSSELGPEFADMKLTDLNPKTFVKKQLAGEIALIDEARRELKDSAGQLTGSVADARRELSGATAATPASLEKSTPFDVEAT